MLPRSCESCRQLCCCRLLQQHKAFPKAGRVVLFGSLCLHIVVTSNFAEHSCSSLLSACACAVCWQVDGGTVVWDLKKQRPVFTLKDSNR